MSKLRTAEPEGFPEFWTAWKPIARHTDGRGLAREAFRKQILHGIDPQDMIDGARWYARNVKEAERPYVPLSATWLNREVYADHFEKEREFQRRFGGESNVVRMNEVSAS